MGTGWYRERVYTQFVLEHTADDLARHMIRELDEGVDDTGIRAGVIGELGHRAIPDHAPRRSASSGPPHGRSSRPASRSPRTRPTTASWPRSSSTCCSARASRPTGS